MTDAPYQQLATQICIIAERLPRIHATFADIDEVDLLARALVALHDQIPPQRCVGNNAIAYWEDRIALLLVMVEASDLLIIRVRRDPVALAALNTLSTTVERLAQHARWMRQEVQRRRFSPRCATCGAPAKT